MSVTRENSASQAAWALAVEILTTAGRMKDGQARAFFGKLLSVNQIGPLDMLPALETAEASGTQDPASYLAAAAKRAHERQGDPALRADWC